LSQGVNRLNHSDLLVSPLVRPQNDAWQWYPSTLPFWPCPAGGNVTVKFVAVCGVCFSTADSELLNYGTFSTILFHFGCLSFLGFLFGCLIYVCHYTRHPQRSSLSAFAEGVSTLSFLSLSILTLP
jgi:hypothetical protein